MLELLHLGQPWKKGTFGNSAYMGRVPCQPNAIQTNKLNNKMSKELMSF